MCPIAKISNRPGRDGSSLYGVAQPSIWMVKSPMRRVSSTTGLSLQLEMYRATRPAPIPERADVNCDKTHNLAALNPYRRRWVHRNGLN
jgi:hypothetical protein